ncbi:hypothetical protein B5X24_HaOG200859 [Helicoverpa armigera]|uniref:Gustatory receptor n=1 Tax=Helicoverpa armigera TaxID=29058 RepID=A0A2W1BI00_HELAM|nr:hypothetical protein B5X24_HaOG200859 [Helicoverpa armigera]
MSLMCTVATALRSSLNTKKALDIGRLQNINVMPFPSNVVDKDVQSILLPLNLLQLLTFCPKYRIKNNVVYPNSLIAISIIVIATSIFVLSFVYRSYYLLSANVLPWFSDFSVYFDVIFYSIGFIMNCFFIIVQSKQNVQFVLIFQSLHSFLKETNLKNLVIWNWVFVILVLLVFHIIFIYLLVILKLPFHFLYYSILLNSLDFHIVYASRLMKLLEHKLILWNIQVLSCQGNIDESYGKRLFQAYIDMLQCYELVKVFFQQFVKVLVHSLFYIKASLDLFSMTVKLGQMHRIAMAALSISSIVIWLVKNLLWQIQLTVQCERFYSVILHSQDTCAIVLNSNGSEAEKRLCKNVRRVTRARFSKLRVCALFYVDASLQLSLMALLTDYIVVLLQFAFLDP